MRVAAEKARLRLEAQHAATEAATEQERLRVELFKAEQTRVEEEERLVAEEAELIPGDAVEILKTCPLGKGAQAAVWGGFLTRRNGNIEKVALKISHKATKEAEALFGLRHPNIVEFKGKVNEKIIVFEWMDGCVQELLEKMASKERIKLHWTPFDELDLAIQLASALAYLESQSMTHRDVALRNIMYAIPGGHPVYKLGDFGLARVLKGLKQLYRPLPGSTTPMPYRTVSIEQYNDAISSPGSDVWGLGAMMTEMVTMGGLPFSDLDDDAFDEAMKGGEYDKFKKLFEREPDWYMTIADGIFTDSETRIKPEEILLILQKALKLLVDASADALAPVTFSAFATEKQTFPMRITTYGNVEKKYLVIVTDFPKLLMQEIGYQQVLFLLEFILTVASSKVDGKNIGPLLQGLLDKQVFGLYLGEEYQIINFTDEDIYNLCFDERMIGRDLGVNGKLGHDRGVAVFRGSTKSGSHTKGNVKFTPGGGSIAVKNQFYCTIPKGVWKHSSAEKAALDNFLKSNEIIFGICKAVALACKNTTADPPLSKLSSNTSKPLYRPIYK